MTLIMGIKTVFAKYAFDNNMNLVQAFLNHNTLEEVHTKLLEAMICGRGEHVRHLYQKIPSGI
jgi:hypothetical protein